MPPGTTTPGALHAAREMAAAAQRGGLLEWQCEALLLIARLDLTSAAEAAQRQGQALARAQGFGWLIAADGTPA